MSKANEVMVSKVITVAENALVLDVLKHFITHRISGLPVVNSANEVVGFISDGDLLKSIGHHKPMMIDAISVAYSGIWYDQEGIEDKIKELLQLNVLELATRKVISVDYDAEIGDVSEILGQKKIKKVPVLQDGKLVGIISRGDLLRFVGSRFL
ncbi:CBS domain-containing protein [Paenibacillus psychroresistens]|uniref:CBS domain-containing protein n=1 Tax=Paenibacillus psychroresistens TaxID=1778678 RepID=A0A6B8RVE1_9BACL|nr:CBS domain-containing protein [Paenibacillus psychroresistens]QGQ99595.1 CBS domain-containing protein [Paenibacillus psychroresistens]